MVAGRTATTHAHLSITGSSPQVSTVTSKLTECVSNQQSAIETWGSKLFVLCGALFDEIWPCPTRGALPPWLAFGIFVKHYDDRSRSSKFVWVLLPGGRDGAWKWLISFTRDIREFKSVFNYIHKSNSRPKSISYLKFSCFSRQLFLTSVVWLIWWG